MKYTVAVPRSINIPEMVDFLAQVYGPTYQHAYNLFSVIFNNEPSICPSNFILARNYKGELIGIVRIVERAMIVDEANLACAGISSVAVKSDWRGKGVCSAMMRKAIALMKERRYDISILHARRILDGYYVQFGYHGVGRYIDLEVLNFPAGVKADFKAGALKEDDIAFVQKLYRRTYAQLSGSMVRTSAIWNLLIRRISNNVLKADIVIFMVGVQKVGYAVIADSKLVELSVPKKYFPAVISWFEKKKLQSIAVHPAHPFFIYCRSNLNTILKERFSLDGGYMARVINAQSLAAKLGSRFNQSVRRNSLTQVSFGSFFYTSLLDEV